MGYRVWNVRCILFLGLFYGNQVSFFLLISRKHSEYYPNFNFKWEHGKKIQTSKYYWYSGNDCIYTAKCINGKVEEVWDNRDHHVTDNIFNTDSYTKKNSKNKEEKTTEFDPDEHDIEQYYEDFKDEEGFEDIDDAYEDFEDNPEYWDDY